MIDISYKVMISCFFIEMWGCRGTNYNSLEMITLCDFLYLYETFNFVWLLSFINLIVV